MILGATWTRSDPLTISETSVLTSDAIDSLLDCVGESGDHTHGCTCNLIRRHYGARPFKCRFIHCSFRHQGFETQSERRSHERHHDRPWKCGVPTCEYAGGGFLSRKMRDDHLDRYHQMEEHARDFSKVQVDNAEMKSVWSDLIIAGNSEAAEALRDTFGTLYYGTQCSLFRLAAADGSPTLLTTILSLKYYDKESEWECQRLPLLAAASAVKSQNIENLKILLNAIKTKITMGHHSLCSEMFSEVLNSDSVDIYEEFEANARLEIDLVSSISGGSKSVTAARFCGPSVLRTTAGNLHRQRLVLRLWRSIDLNGILDPVLRGDALGTVAASCCSVLLAEYLIQGGADVNHRRSDKYLTPLHHAARNTSAEAADFMRFLLLHGADPERLSGRSKQQIGEEKGATGISRWLGISWEELIDQCNKVRRDDENTE